MGQCYIGRYFFKEVPTENLNFISPIDNYGVPYGDVIIPLNISGLSAKLFQNNTNITTMSYLKDENNESNIVAIEPFCFERCTNLGEFTIPEKVTTIPENCFSNCDALNSLIFDAKRIEKIEEFAFLNCTSINYDFKDCDLSSLYYLGESAFDNANITDEVLDILFKNFNNQEDIPISDRKTHIGASVFQNNEKLTNATFYCYNDSSTLFRNCVNLKEVSLYPKAHPGSIFNSDEETIPPFVIANCDKLETINIYITNNRTYYGTIISSNAFIYTPAKNINYYYLYNNEWRKYNGLVVQRVGEQSFYGCKNLNLDTVSISTINGTSSGSIGSKAFYNCSLLNHFILMGDNFSNKYTFSSECCYNTSLKDIIYVNMHDPEGKEDNSFKINLSTSAFEKTQLDTKSINLLTEKAEQFITSKSSSNYIETIIKLSTNSIFKDIPNQGLQEEITVKLNDTCKSFFENCQSLGNVYLTSNFGNNVTLTLQRYTYVDPDHVLDTIWDKCFYNCKNLKTFNYADDAKIYQINEAAFANSGLESFKIPKGLIAINQGAFQNCTNLTSVAPEEAAPTVSSLSIGESAFANCDNLTEFIFPDRTLSIGINCFSGCGLESIDLPSNLSYNSIGNYAFQGCTNLKEITIRNLSDSIYFSNGYKFRLCTNVEKITLKDEVGRINTNVITSEILTAEMKKSIKEINFIFDKIKPSMGGVGFDLNVMSNLELMNITFPNATSTVYNFTENYFVDSEANRATREENEQPVKLFTLQFNPNSAKYAVDIQLSKHCFNDVFISELNFPRSLFNSIKVLNDIPIYNCANLEKLTLTTSILNNEYLIPEEDRIIEIEDESETRQLKFKHNVFTLTNFVNIMKDESRIYLEGPLTYSSRIYTSNNTKLNQPSILSVLDSIGEPAKLPKPIEEMTADEAKILRVLYLAKPTTDQEFEVREPEGEEFEYTELEQIALDLYEEEKQRIENDPDMTEEEKQAAIEAIVITIGDVIIKYFKNSIWSLEVIE